MARYSASILGEENSVVELVNQNQYFTISGTTTVPDGSMVEMRIGRHIRYGQVQEGEFSIEFDRKVKKQDYIVYLTFKKNVIFTALKKSFTLRVIDTEAPGRVSVSSFSMAKSTSGKMLLTWSRPQEMFDIKRYNLFKNGVYVATVRSSRYITDSMQMNDVDAYRIVAVDNSENVSTYSLGLAVSRQKHTQNNVVRPALTIIDHLTKTYSEEVVENEVVINPVYISYSSLFNNSDICDLTKAGDDDNRLSFIVSSVEPDIGTLQLITSRGNKVLEIGDIVRMNDSIAWTPSEKFESTTKIATFKAINNNQMESTTSASLYVNLI